MVNSQFAEEEPTTPNMRTISELEADLQQSEKTLSDLTTNFNALKKSQIELTELKHVLSFADQFLKVCLFITKYLYFKLLYVCKYLKQVLTVWTIELESDAMSIWARCTAE